MGQCRRLIELEAEAKKAGEQARVAKQAAESAREALALRMMAEGCDGAKVDGRTVYLRTDLFASMQLGEIEKAGTTVREVLEANDMGFLVKETVDARSFKSALRELVNQAREDNLELMTQDAQAAIPEGLRPFVRTYEETRARTRKA